MRRNRGFFLIHELLCFGFCSLLLAHTAQCLTACLRAQEQALYLQGAFQAGQLALFGQEVAAPYRAELEYGEQHGLRLVEVRVYGAHGAGPLCSLVQNVP